MEDHIKGSVELQDGTTLQNPVADLSESARGGGATRRRSASSIDLGGMRRSASSIELRGAGARHDDARDDAESTTTSPSFRRSGSSLLSAGASPYSKAARRKSERRNLGTRRPSMV